MTNLMRNAARASVLALACVASSAQAEWITTWATAPLPASEPSAFSPGSRSFENQTLRQIVRVSAGGSSVRIRISNAYGAEALQVGAARIALVDADGNEIAGSSRTLTFSGDASSSAAAGSPLLSDSVDLEIPALAKMAITLYFPENTGPCTCHQVGLDRLEISAPGDFSAAPFEPAEVLMERAFLAAVEIDAPEGSGTVVAFGDSITDGVGSTAEQDTRWPDYLATRLAERDGAGAVWGVANLGISGNRVMGDGAGESALARFDRDVLSQAGVKAVIIFEGVNDLGIGHGEFEGPAAEFMAQMTGRGITAEEIIAGYRQLLERAHARGVLVYGATIAPYRGASYWSEAGEAERVKINDWIMNSGELDASLDFSAVFSGSGAADTMADGMHMGDFLHGSDAGYQAIAESIDLALFED